MKPIELKFLLTLLTKPGYGAPINKVVLHESNKRARAVERDRTCRDLAERDLVACEEEVTKIKISPSGKTLLRLDVANLPVSELELQVLEAAINNPIVPSKTKVTPAKLRQEVIEGLIEKGFIIATRTKLRAVQLTPRGEEFLAYYEPLGGGNYLLSKKMLGNYLKFMREYFSSDNVRASFAEVQPPRPEKPEQETRVRKEETQTDDGYYDPDDDEYDEYEDTISDKDILEAIIELDRQLYRDNYLPIFHLRDEFQPPLSREELDEALYRLQSSNKIDLHSLAEVHAYIEEEVEAGIPQPVGGALFFISVNR